MRKLTIEVKLGKERHRLLPNEDGITGGCTTCSMRGVCDTIGSTSHRVLCDALIYKAYDYDYPKEIYPTGGHFVEKGGNS